MNRRGFLIALIGLATWLAVALVNRSRREDSEVIREERVSGRDSSMAGESSSAKTKTESRADLSLPALDHEKLLQEAEGFEKQGRYLFATSREVNIAPHLAGRWREDGDRKVWEFSLRSENAHSLNLGFREFHLPPDSEFTISDPSGKSQPITFDARDNDEHGELWTPLIASDSLRLSLNVPGQLASQTRLRLSKVNHGFRPPTRRKDGKAIGDSSSGSCNVDVICNAEDDATFGPLVDLYRDQIRSVAAYTLGGVETCSGALINNARNDLTPYFLTANHCGISSANAASIVVYWNFENSTCRTPGSSGSGGNGNGPITQFNSGSIFRASRAESDFCLIELDDAVDPTFSPYYAGWDRSGDNPVSAVGIHHPGVSEKRISFESDATTTTSYYSNSSTPNGTHVRVEDWDFGTTEGGSSGSPLFDDRGHIIGQLHGGDAACGNDDPDWYGRLSRSWNDGGSSASRLSDWLDPDGSGVEKIAGINSDETLSVTGGSLAEGDGGSSPLEVTVNLSEATDEIVTVTLKTADGSATAEDNDFVPVNVPLEFAPGELSKTVTVMVNGDLLPEENESFSLVLEDAVNAFAPGEAAVVVILNDDFIPPVIDGSLVASAAVSGLFEYQISAQNTPTGFAISNAPNGMVIDEVTGVISWAPTLEGDVTVGITASNPAGSSTEILAITVLPNLLVQAVDLASLMSLSNSSPGWFSQSETTRDGVDAAQAQALDDGGVARFAFEIEGPDRLTFQAKVNSEVDYDFFTVELDGLEEVSLSGEVDWSSYFVNIPEGRHTIAFQYVKDGSVSAGEDTAWVDQFVLASESGRPVIVSSLNLRIDTGAEVDYTLESIVPEAEFSVSGLPAGLSFDGENLIGGTLPEQGTFTFSVVSSANGETDSATVEVIVANPLGPSVEVTNFPWIREGDADWFGQSEVTFDGVDAARSGDVGGSESASMSIRVTGPERMTFWWKVSSEEGFDGMTFVIDGEEVPGVGQISGEQDWAYVQVPIPSGSHLLTWSYSKDDGVDEGDDAGWVDDIRFALGSRPFIWTSTRHEVVANREIRVPLELVNADEYSFQSLPAWLEYDDQLQALVGTSPGAGEYSFTVSASNSFGNASLPLVVSAQVPNLILAGAVEQPDEVVVTNGARDWFAESSAEAVGGTAARSGDIDSSESSSMVIFVQGPGTLGYRWMVSSEEDFDFLHVSVNGVRSQSISGEVGWEEMSVDLEPGLNQVSWTYEKDSSASEGQDLGRVDEITFGGFARFLSENELDHFSSEPGDDLDGDGYSLLHEYAFLGSPAAAEFGSPLSLAIDSNSPTPLELSFRGVNPGEGIVYRLEASDLLENDWEEWAILPEVISEVGESRYQFTADTLEAGRRARFYRIRAEFSRR